MIVLKHIHLAVDPDCRRLVIGAGDGQIGGGVLQIGGRGGIGVELGEVEVLHLIVLIVLGGGLVLGDAFLIVDRGHHSAVDTTLHMRGDEVGILAGSAQSCPVGHAVVQILPIHVVVHVDGERLVGEVIIVGVVVGVDGGQSQGVGLGGNHVAGQRRGCAVALVDGNGVAVCGDDIIVERPGDGGGEDLHLIVSGDQTGDNLGDIHLAGIIGAVAGLIGHSALGVVGAILVDRVEVLDVMERVGQGALGQDIGRFRHAVGHRDLGNLLGRCSNSLHILAHDDVEGHGALADDGAGKAGARLGRVFHLDVGGQGDLDALVLLPARLRAIAAIQNIGNVQGGNGGGALAVAGLRSSQMGGVGAIFIGVGVVGAGLGIHHSEILHVILRRGHDAGITAGGGDDGSVAAAVDLIPGDGVVHIILQGDGILSILLHGR